MWRKGELNYVAKFLNLLLPPSQHKHTPPKYVLDLPEILLKGFWSFLIPFHPFFKFEIKVIEAAPSPLFQGEGSRDVPKISSSLFSRLRFHICLIFRCLIFIFSVFYYIALYLQPLHAILIPILHPSPLFPTCQLPSSLPICKPRL